MNKVKVKMYRWIVYFVVSDIFYYLILEYLGMQRFVKIDYEIIFMDNTKWQFLFFSFLLAIVTFLFTNFNEEDRMSISLKKTGFYSNVKTKPAVVSVFLIMFYIVLLFVPHAPQDLYGILLSPIIIFITLSSIFLGLYGALLIESFKYLKLVLRKRWMVYVALDILYVLVAMIDTLLIMRVNLQDSALAMISAAIFSPIFMYIYESADYSIYLLWIVHFVNYEIAFLSTYQLR
ncbi:hypothetical protein [Athalassotoga saccharophila]|uniref:hypothetical protein n=1 Tax=Athalassotoga saccharophila TaxID=1441386 RepID=UPI00137AD62C|nr:hypothetical protein [Athalassotoga saccharophila]BBJ28363.1 hypothetical protein ATHSA_1276 [Athalassotoga saccharophila]